MRTTIAAAVLLSFTTSMAHADLVVTFRDGAPKDRFTLTNTASCATKPMAVTLDLSSARAGLIFDITAAGEGVEVFQPFELTSGGDVVRSISEVKDGDQQLQLALAALAPGAEVAFTIDLDDTGGAREITVSGAEIAGATVQASTGAVGVFGTDGNATVALVGCAS